MPQVNLGQQRTFVIMVVGYRNYAEDHKALWTSPAIPMPTEYVDGDKQAMMYQMNKRNAEKAVRSFVKNKIYRKQIGQRFMMQNEIVMSAYDVTKREQKVFKMRLQKHANGRVSMANPRLMTTYHDVDAEEAFTCEPIRQLMQQVQ